MSRDEWSDAVFAGFMAAACLGPLILFWAAVVWSWWTS